MLAYAPLSSTQLMVHPLNYNILKIGVIRYLHADYLSLWLIICSYWKPVYSQVASTAIAWVAFDFFLITFQTFTRMFFFSFQFVGTFWPHVM